MSTRPKTLRCVCVIAVCVMCAVAALAQQECPAQLILENQYYQATFATTDGIVLEKLIHKKVGENLIKEPGKLLLFSLQLGKTILTPADFKVTSYTKEDVGRKVRRSFTLVPKSGGEAAPVPLELIFSITTDESWDITLGLKIKNTSRL